MLAPFMILYGYNTFVMLSLMAYCYVFQAVWRKYEVWVSSCYHVWQIGVLDMSQDNDINAPTKLNDLGLHSIPPLH